MTNNELCPIFVNVRKVTGIGPKENLTDKPKVPEQEKYNTWGCPESGLRKQ